MTLILHGETTHSIELVPAERAEGTNERKQKSFSIFHLQNNKIKWNRIKFYVL